MKKIFFVLMSTILALLTLQSKVLASVPAPDIPTSNPPYVGAYYMPMGKTGEPVNWYRKMANYDPAREPLLGYFDEDNTEAMDWQIKWALESGINFFIFNWYRCNDGDPRAPCTGSNGVQGKSINPSYSGAVGDALTNGFLKSTYQNQMKFAINLIRPPFTTDADLTTNLLPFLINNYFKKPNYLKINNRPVIFFYSIYNPTQSAANGLFNTTRINTLRQAIMASGLGNPILIAEDRNFTARYTNFPNFQSDLKTTGYDYTYAYWPLVYNLDGAFHKPLNESEAIKGEEQSYDYLSANQTLPFIVSVNAMSNGIFDSPPWVISPAGYSTLLTYLKTHVMPGINGPLGKQMIIVDAWNEYFEGHWVAPTKKYGFSYLQAIRNILTNRDNTPSYATPAPHLYDSSYQAFSTHVKDYSSAQNSKYAIAGAGNFIAVVHAPNQDTDKLSFGGWVNMQAPASNSIVMNKNWGTFATNIKSDGSGRCMVSGTPKDSSSPPSGSACWGAGKISFNTWQHFMCVYDGTRIRAYINGALAQTTGCPTDTTQITMKESYDDLILGRSGFVGSIANIRVLPTPLPASDISSLYQTTRPPAKPGDFNDDGNINLDDYNLIKANFSSHPYTIFDYNNIVTNFGK